MASEADKSAKNSKSKKLTQEEIVNNFNRLRMQQKNFVTKLSEVEQEFNEHVLVASTLNDVSEDRVCYQMIGGVLVQRIVKDVVPSVNHNKEQLKKAMDDLNKQIEAKGRELKDFKEQYNIQFHREPSMQIIEPQGSKDEAKTSGGGILVAGS